MIRINSSVVREMTTVFAPPASALRLDGARVLRERVELRARKRARRPSWPAATSSPRRAAISRASDTVEHAAHELALAVSEAALARERLVHRRRVHDAGLLRERRRRDEKHREKDDRHDLAWDVHQSFHLHTVPDLGPWMLFTSGHGRGRVRRTDATRLHLGHGRVQGWAAYFTSRSSWNAALPATSAGRSRRSRMPLRRRKKSNWPSMASRRAQASAANRSCCRVNSLSDGVDHDLRLLLRATPRTGQDGCPCQHASAASGVLTSLSSLSVQLPRSAMIVLALESRRVREGMTHGLTSTSGSSTVTS